MKNPSLPYEFEVLKIYTLGNDTIFQFIAIGPPAPNADHKGVTQFMKEFTLSNAVVEAVGPKWGVQNVIEAIQNMGWAEIEITMLKAYGPDMFQRLLKENKPYYETIRKNNS